MTVIREEDMIIMPQIEESFDCSEMYDISRFFIPAEIYTSDKEIAW